jgi:hypothetical protein
MWRRLTLCQIRIAAQAADRDAEEEEAIAMDMFKVYWIKYARLSIPVPVLLPLTLTFVNVGSQMILSL